MTFDDFRTLVIARRTQLMMDLEREVDMDLINKLCDVAAWAPNHQLTWPWLFGVFTGDARGALGDATAEAMQRHGDTEMKVTKTRTKYLRAPVIVVVGTLQGESELQTEENRDAVVCRNSKHVARRHRNGTWQFLVQLPERRKRRCGEALWLA